MFGLTPAGHGGTDQDLVLAGVTMEQRLEGGQQQHEESHRLGSREGAEPFGQCVADGEVHYGPPERLHRGPGPVGREVEHGQFAGQALQPVRLKAFPFRAREHPGLPAGEVLVLAARGRQGRGGEPAPPLVLINDDQLVDERVERPEIGGDVVHGEQRPCSRGDRVNRRTRSMGPRSRSKG